MDTHSLYSLSHQDKMADGMFLHIAHDFHFLFCTFINGLQPITANFFTAIGKANRGIFLSLTRQVIFLLPLMIILPIFFGIEGVMFSAPIADGFAAVCAITFAVKELKSFQKL